MRRHLLVTAAAAVAVAACALTTAGTAAADPDEMSQARKGTAEFHRVTKAESSGYGLFRDAAGTACIEHPDLGGMGIHYANGDLVGDPAVAAASPEVLVYAPQPDGRLRLAGVEYVVLQQDWHAAGHGGPPRLFGRDFSAVPAGNRYGLPPFYALHAWIWEHNPAGMLADWNPRVDCP